MKKYAHSIRALVALVTLVMVVGCSSPINPEAFIDVKLEHGSLAPLGGTMTLRAVVNAYIDGPNTEITFTIPPGVVVVNGQPHQNVYLHKGEQRTFEIQVQLTQPGEQRIDVGAVIHQGPDSLVGDYDALYFEVSKAGTEVRKESIIPTPTLEGLNQRERLRQLVTPTPLP